MNNKTNVNSIDTYSLKGQWSYRFEDQEGNQVGQEIEGTNIVTKAAYDTIFTNLGAAFNNTRRVFIGNMGTDEKFNRTVIPSIAVGTLESFIYTPRAGVNDPYADWECRINFTGSRRIFRSIGLSSEAAPASRLAITSTITVTAVTSNTITVSLGTAQVVRDTANTTGIRNCWVTKDSVLGESGYEILSINDSGSLRTSFTITFTENVGSYFQVGNIVYIANTLNTAFAYSKIEPVKYNITLTAISGNDLTFSISDALAFGTNSLAQQYISSNISNNFGTLIQGNTLIQTSDTNITLTVAANDLGNFAIGNGYFLTVYPVQESNITLFVKYRISLVWDENYGNTFPDFKYSLENRIFDVGTAITLNHASYGYGNPDTILEVTNKLSNRNAYTPTHSITNTTFNTSHMYKRVFPSPVTDGILYSYIALGNDPNTEQAIWFKGVENTRSPIQNQFPHSPIHLLPFYSSVAENLPGGSLKPIVSGNWTEWLPHMYEFVIDQPGLIGISTYKIKQYIHTMGTNGNATSMTNAQVLTNPLLSRWNNKAFATPGKLYMNNTIATLNGSNASHIVPESQISNWFYSVEGARIPFGRFGFLQCSSSYFTIVEDAYEGTTLTYNNASFPILTNLNLTQVSIPYYVDPNSIWIACRNNGLYKLDFNTQIITLEHNEPCYGVDYKDSGEIIALFDSGFRSDSDNFGSVIGDASGILKSEVKFIKLDQKEVVETRVFCCGKDTLDNVKDIWYFWTDTFGTLNRVFAHTTEGGTINYNGRNLTFRGIHSNFCFNTVVYNNDSGGFLLCTFGGRTVGCTFSCSMSRAVGYVFAGFSSGSAYYFNYYHLFVQRSGTDDGGETFKLFSHGKIVTPFKKVGAGRNQVGGPILGDLSTRDIQILSPLINSGLVSWTSDPYSNSCTIYNTYDIKDNRCAYISENTISRFPYEIREPFYANTWGWNSTTGEWEIDNDNLLQGKPTHSTTQPIIDGLEVRWDELSPEQPYAMSTGEYFNCFVNHGMFKDPYITNPTYTFYFTMRPTVQYTVNTVIGAGLTYQLPFVNDDALFAYVLLDGANSKLLHSVAISGYGSTVESIIVGTVASAPNTIAINTERGGLITFNAADVGKTFTGTITYTRKYHPTEVTV